ncbi:5-formyltetrahydrofolate cyclo-ligase isoform X3 [Gorilla gorilla gorilla]|uniref:5-formyltetrahydrofolate cyclo-ligase isoform X3 n=1 Tax=Gorilla gorilla gorilla TaxID=9595 RepID=UPI00300A6469
MPGTVGTAGHLYHPRQWRCLLRGPGEGPGSGRSGGRAVTAPRHRSPNRGGRAGPRGPHEGWVPRARGEVIAHSEYQKSKRISIFLSMQDEIETEEIIKDIFQRGKICFIPRYQFQNNHMDMVRVESPEEISLLPKTSWNIPQPGEGDVREEALSTGDFGWPPLDPLSIFSTCLVARKTSLCGLHQQAATKTRGCRGT